MGRQPSLTPKQLMLMILSCLLMYLAPTDAGLTSKAPGFIMHGSHTRVFPQEFPSNGRSFSPYLQQTSHGDAKWQRKRVRFNCDNQAIVLDWQGKLSKQPLNASLLRMLFLTAAQHNFTVTLRHLRGKENDVADALSRRQFTRFPALAPQTDKRPTTTPGILNTI